ncbi:hypothetical protein FDF11_14250 [Clostridium botulinum]|nr:hypothetical protein [Clostridium botulinum]NFR14794.1 hypothetical protein [Clostridium botulinum]NFR44902.1 hypothetical protein [Clostridium botulinum]NFS51793.1 hypothetical protein [Clostridium botulinum]
MKIDSLKELLKESKKLMLYSMSMKDATNYTCEEDFNLENYTRILGNARRELIEIDEENN